MNAFRKMQVAIVKTPAYAKIKKTPIYTVYDTSRNFINSKSLSKKKLSAKWNKYYTLRVLFPKIYNKYAKLPVDENKVVFVEIRMPEITNSCTLLYDELANKYNYTIHTHFLRNQFAPRKLYNKRCCDLMKDIATAKYIFTDDTSTAMSCIQMRPETVYTQLWHGCGAFKKFGLSTAELLFGLSKEEMLRYPMHENYTNVMVSSPEVAWAYEEAMALKPGVAKAWGSSRSDVFYDKRFIDGAFDKLHKIMPESIGKKVILYAPTFRGRVVKAQSSNMLSIKLFEQELGDEYVLLFKHHPFVKKPPQVSIKYASFAKDVTECMSIEELLCVSDICISDYSSLVFEYSLFERPLIFFAYDIDEYNDWRGFYYNYDELAPGPIFKTNLDMIDYIKNIDTRFDKERIHAFREKFMSSCDGHATQRIMENVFGESLQAHRKPDSEITDYPLHVIPKGYGYFSDTETQIEELKEYKADIQSIYDAGCKAPIVKNRIAFVINDKSSSSVRYLQKVLEDNDELEIVEINEDVTTLAALLATARVVILETASKLVSAIKFREGTQIIQLTNNTLPVSRIADASVAHITGYDKEETDIIPNHAKYNVIPVASDFAKQAYSEICSVTDEAVFEPIGTIKSDLLLDEKAKAEIKERLIEAIPEAEKKKIIFYMPTERINKTQVPLQAAFFETKMMFEYLEKEYIVLYSYSEMKKNKLSVSKNYKSFIHNVRNLPKNPETEIKPTFSEAELLAVADIVIGDYKAGTFDFIVTGKPLFFFTPDLAMYDTLGNSFIDYEALTDGLRYTDTVELAKAILDIEHYDYTRVNALKNEYFTYCNGKAAQNMTEIIKNML